MCHGGVLLKGGNEQRIGNRKWNVKEMFKMAKFHLRYYKLNKTHLRIKTSHCGIIYFPVHTKVLIEGT